MNKQELNEILDKHFKWLNNEDDGERANLWGADLRGANLWGANLWGANLRVANLRGADLRGANLRGANLRGANLRGANLRGADLWGANLRGTDLRGANFRGANLRGANLRGTDLRGANFRGANLRGADLWGASGNSKQIKSLSISEVYPITYTSEYLQIGCERHFINDWWEFDNERIKKMDGQQALDFWADWKDQLKTLIEKYPAVETKHEK